MTRPAVAAVAVALVAGLAAGMAGVLLAGHLGGSSLAEGGLPVGTAAAITAVGPSQSVRPRPSGSAAPSADAIPSSSSSPTSPASSPSASAAPQSSSPTPAPTPYRGPVTATVPVLMYHSISDPPPGALYPGLYVSPVAFKAQMRALHDAGWHTITAGQLGAAMAANRLVPVRTLVLMFDDGYEDNFTNAFPILEQFGDVATFSVVARGGPSMLTSSQLAAMTAAGMEVGNHTLDHRNVSRLAGPQLWKEIAGGAAKISERLASQGVSWLGVSFVYPSGHVGPAAISLLDRLHYLDAFTTVPGFAVIGSTPSLRIPRVRVSRFESLAEFLARLPVEPPRP